MVNYNECNKTCSDYYYDENKKECNFKKMCVVMELPIEEGDEEWQKLLSIKNIVSK